VSITRLVGKLLRSGVHEGMRPVDAKYFVLCNALVLALMTICLCFFWPFSFLLNDTLSQVAIPVLCAALGLCLWLNHRQKIAASVAWLEGVTILTAAVIVVGRGPGIQYLLLMHAVLPFLLLPRGHEVTMGVLAGAGIAAFLGLTIVSGSPPIAGTMPATLIVLSGLSIMLAIGGYIARSASLNAEARVEREHQKLEEERGRSEMLLRNILPVAIAERLKEAPTTIADRYDDVSVLFADLSGFTQLSQQLTPEEVVATLNTVFSVFDELADRHCVEKIKTIGDAYMLASGLPETRPNHLEAAAGMAIDMRDAIAALKLRDLNGEPVKMRIGLHAGPVVAGVIGKKKFSFDLWGDTVNTASRMESHGTPGRIHVSAVVHERLQHAFEFEERGLVSIKSKGEMATYFLERRLANAPDVTSGSTA
jgi:class 3 adenylate cyclase